MKILMLLLCFPFFLHLAASQKEDKGKITCLLQSSRSKYRLGEVPQLEVRLVNNTNKEIYLIGSLDGSDRKRRMPWCYFTIEKPAPDTLLFSGCGTVNPLRKEDFVAVQPGGSFNPCQQMDGNGFFHAYETAQPETFRQSGTYKIQFHYSTKRDSLSEYLGNGNWYKNNDSVQIKNLFAKVPRLEISSNILEIQIQ